MHFIAGLLNELPVTAGPCPHIAPPLRAFFTLTFINKFNPSRICLPVISDFPRRQRSVRTCLY
ncbi:hypothetical protein BD293_0285 [Roseinatronobacter monicus]|uniref:Uncharacterized protein n=1 Tax=Roseinatronobacter monicus TaxID=393481 RepID=A0A543K9F2_9RHOB|nr:hypothetical protein BD293_0285 [Roseinatronobacter monicus]